MLPHWYKGTPFKLYKCQLELRTWFFSGMRLYHRLYVFARYILIMICCGNEIYTCTWALPYVQLRVVLLLSVSLRFFGAVRVEEYKNHLKLFWLLNSYQSKCTNSSKCDCRRQLYFDPPCLSSVAMWHNMGALKKARPTSSPVTVKPYLSIWLPCL